MGDTSSSSVDKSASPEGIGSGCASVISVAGSEPKCYMHGTLFRSGNGGKISVEDLQVEDVLLDSHGIEVKVKSIRRHASGDRSMVLLETSEWKVPLTSSHRVMVCRRTTTGEARKETIPAGHLCVGQEVLCSNGPQTLITAQAFLGDDDVFEIVLENDVDIETFFVTENDAGALLTKAKKGFRNRRGGMKKQKISADAASEVDVE